MPHTCTITRHNMRIRIMTTLIFMMTQKLILLICYEKIINEVTVVRVANADNTKFNFILRLNKTTDTTRYYRENVECTYTKLCKHSVLFLNSVQPVNIPLTKKWENNQVENRIPRRNNVENINRNLSYKCDSQTTVHP